MNVLIPFGAGMFFYMNGAGLSLHHMCLNPFWCRDVFLLESGLITGTGAGLNPFWCRDVFLWSDCHGVLTLHEVLIPFGAGMFFYCIVRVSRPIE